MFKQLLENLEKELRRFAFIMQDAFIHLEYTNTKITHGNSEIRVSGINPKTGNNQIVLLLPDSFDNNRISIDISESDTFWVSINIESEELASMYEEHLDQAVLNWLERLDDDVKENIISLENNHNIDAEEYIEKYAKKVFNKDITTAIVTSGHLFTTQAGANWAFSKLLDYFEKQLEGWREIQSF